MGWLVPWIVHNGSTCDHAYQSQTANAIWPDGTHCSRTNGRWNSHSAPGGRRSHSRSRLQWLDASLSD